MAPSQALLLNRGPVCRRCLVVSAIAIVPIQRRSISSKYLRKLAEAERQWQKRAELIKEGKLPNFWDLLEERGYVKDTAGSRDTIRELMRRKRIGAYAGVDPSASSLHVGHLLPLMAIFWMYMHGYRAVTLIGGSTVKIGDPTDRLKTREAMRSADVAINITKIHYQMKKLWTNVEAQAKRFGYTKEWAWRRAIVNNNTWWNSTPMLDVLKRVGRSIRIGPMLSRDTVKRKMTEGDGVSFAEFTYPIMQGWDWWVLFKQQGVQMQIGGSDQYGNIITGIDIVKTARDNEPDPVQVLPARDEFDDPVGFTVPLLTDSSGAKFGKTAGNAVWLDPFMTSPFDLYGYFVRRPDADVEKLLKLFTFIPMHEIQVIMEEQNKDPSKRVAHHRLAFEVLSLVHGEEVARKTQKEHEMMYSKGGAAIPLPTGTWESQYAEPEHQTNPNNAPRIDMILPKSLIMGKSIGRILYAAGLADSPTKGHKLALQQGVYVAGHPGARKGHGEPLKPGELTWTSIKLWFPQETQRYLIDDKILILRKGKHNVRIIEMVSDEEYEKSGQRYPGQPYTGYLRALRQQLKWLKLGKISPERVKEVLQKAAAKEDEAAGPEAIKFPKKKSQEQIDLEAQLEELLASLPSQAEGASQESQAAGASQESQAEKASQESEAAKASEKSQAERASE